MYIEIYPDIVEETIGKGEQIVNDSLELLRLFAIFAAQGRHIVVVPCLRNNKVLAERLKKVMGASSFEKLRRSEEKSYMLSAIKAAVAVYCVVSYDNQAVDDERAIIINPSRMARFEPYLETRLVTENLLDAHFFEYTARFYVRQKLLKGIYMRYDAIPGGGSTTCDVAKREILDAKRFCLVVVDSDRKCPGQTDYGSTAQKIKEVIDTYPSSTCELYIMEKVMEIENLIPKRIVAQYASNKKSCDILEKDFSFFDMKAGITIKGLYDDGVYNYWKTMLSSEGLDFTPRDEAKANSINKKEFERYVDEKGFDNNLKIGFGSDLLRIVTCDLERSMRNGYHTLKDEMYNSIVPEDLSDNQLYEWNNIGKLVYSWTCGLSSRSA